MCKKKYIYFFGFADDFLWTFLNDILFKIRSAKKKKKMVHLV